MYPSEPKPPNKRLADLTTVKEMFQESKETITGYCIKSMTSDPYGHPVLAVTDGKVSGNLSPEIVWARISLTARSVVVVVDFTTFSINFSLIVVGESCTHNVCSFKIVLVKPGC